MALDLGFGQKKSKKGSKSRSSSTLTETSGFAYTEMSPADDGRSASSSATRSGSPRRRESRADTRAPRGDLIERFMAWKLPVIGARPINLQVQVLLIMMALFAIVVAGVLALDLRQSANGALQVEITGDALMHTQRLARAAPYAVAGNKQAFADLLDSRDRIDSNLDALANGDVKRFGALVDRSQGGAERALENQIAETVHLARYARELGADAASAFGAGFGGSVWAMVPLSDAERFATRWRERYLRTHGSASHRSQFFTTRPSSPAFELVDDDERCSG